MYETLSSVPGLTMDTETVRQKKLNYEWLYPLQVSWAFEFFSDEILIFHRRFGL